MPGQIALDAPPLDPQLAAPVRWVSMAEQLSTITAGYTRTEASATNWFTPPASHLTDDERSRELEGKGSAGMRYVNVQADLIGRSQSLPHAAMLQIRAASTHMCNAQRWAGYGEDEAVVREEMARAERALRRAEAAIRRADDLETAQTIRELADLIALMVGADAISAETPRQTVTLAPPGRSTACHPIAANAPPAARHHRAVNRRARGTVSTC